MTVLTPDQEIVIRITDLELAHKHRLEPWFMSDARKLIYVLQYLSTLHTKIPATKAEQIYNAYVTKMNAVVASITTNTQEVNDIMANIRKVHKVLIFFFE